LRRIHGTGEVYHTCYIHREMRSVPVLALLVLATALPGCGGKKKKGDPSYAVFPADSDVLLGIDGPTLRQGHYRRLERALPESVAKAVAGLRSCGIDPVEGVGKVVVAGSSKTRGITARITGFTREDFKQCGELARELKIVDSGATTAFTIRGKTSHMAWMDDRTMLTGPLWKPEELTDLVAGKGKLDGNERLMDMVGDVDTGAPLWVAWAPPGPGLEVPMVGTVRGARLTLSFASGLSLRLAARLASNDEARGAAKLAETALPQFKEDAGELAEFLPKIHIESDGSTVKVSVDLDPAETARLISGVEKNATLRSTLQEVLPF
jgi:hypothetical protein